MPWLPRTWRPALFAVLVPLPLLLWAYQCLFDPRDYLTDGGMAGFYAVIDGVPRTDQVIASAQPGARIAWASVLCPQAGTAMLARLELLDARGHLVWGRTRRWAPNERACGRAIGTMTLPDELPFGDYRLCRVAVLRPDAVLPLVARLGCLAVTLTRRPGADDPEQTP